MSVKIWGPSQTCELICDYCGYGFKLKDSTPTQIRLYRKRLGVSGKGINNRRLWPVLASGDRDSFGKKEAEDYCRDYCKEMAKKEKDE